MSLADELQKKLQGGKFRLLNEKMYKNKELTSKEAEEYHKLYTNQIKKWPSDPKKVIIQKITENEQSNLKMADLGSGSAMIAESFPNVVSYDKYPVNDKIVKCELRKIPSEDAQFDVCICCLSLMMTGITGVLKEINRILKIDGVFYLAEVTSRVKNMRKFISDIEKIGFKVNEVDKTNKCFFLISFVKKSDVAPDSRLPSIELGSWLYKKR